MSFLTTRTWNISCPLNGYPDARLGEFLSQFNFKISYKPGPQCKADILIRRSQDLPTDSNPCQDYMEQVVLKPKNLSIIQPVQILCHGKIMPVEAEPTDQDLKTTIKNCENLMPGNLETPQQPFDQPKRVKRAQ